MKGMFHQKSDEKKKVVVFHQSVFLQADLSSGWSLLMEISPHGELSLGKSLIRVVFHQVGLSSGRSCPHGGLSVGKSLIMVVLSGWSFIRVVLLWEIFPHGGLSVGKSLIRVVFH